MAQLQKMDPNILTYCNHQQYFDAPFCSHPNWRLSIALNHLDFALCSNSNSRWKTRKGLADIKFTRKNELTIVNLRTKTGQNKTRTDMCHKKKLFVHQNLVDASFKASKDSTTELWSCFRSNTISTFRNFGFSEPPNKTTRKFQMFGQKS